MTKHKQKQFLPEKLLQQIIELEVNGALGENVQLGGKERPSCFRFRQLFMRFINNYVISITSFSN